MEGISYSGLVTQIRNYTEVDSTVFSADQLENVILNAQYRIMRDVPIDADRKQQSGNLVPGQETINAPGGALFIRGIQVYDSSAVLTGSNTWLEKKDVHTYKNINRLQAQLQHRVNQNIMLCLVMPLEMVILILDVYF